MIFVSGQIAIDPATKEFSDDNIRVQTRQVIENIKSIVEDTGNSLENVLKVTIFITDIKNFNQVNQVYEEYFGTSLPARACVEVSNLPKGAKIEMEAIAAC
jgi:2-iminobutanoate/2-iminopropanoate deaminase